MPCGYNVFSAFFLFKCCATAVALSTLFGNWRLRGSGTIDLYFLETAVMAVLDKLNRRFLTSLTYPEENRCISLYWGVAWM